MCGLVGAVQFGATVAPIRLDIDSAMRQLLNRGPDGSGVFSEKGVVLGHRRLAIIDLSEAARQPMTSACGRYVIIFNGEVYNFSELRSTLQPIGGWRTDSDTETVLEAYAKWGASCLSQFHGMFAIVIWDRLERQLFIARDRLGVKPLYYAHSPGFVGFSSRPGALRVLIPSLSGAIDRQAVRLYLECGYVPAPLCFFASMRKLEAGHYLLADASGIENFRYWTLDNVPSDPETSNRDENDLVDELEELVDRSIRWRMVSSVPVGTFLSGGVDSGLVVSRMAKIARTRIKTFTIGFSEREFDESATAAEIAKLNDTEHFAQRISSKDLISLLPLFLKEFDEPFFDHSAIAVMAVSRLARDHVKVVLSGDGGDEAFGGYHYYRAMAWFERAHKFPAIARSGVGALMKHFPGRIGMVGEALQRPTIARAFAFARSVIKSNGSILCASLVNDTNSFEEMLDTKAREFPKGLTASEVAMRLDISYTLPDDYLQKVDVASMAYSIEAREPLLDHSIMEWAARLSTSWKLRGLESKYLLKRLAYRNVPRKLLDKPKRGFGLPMNEWLRTDLRSWGRSLLCDSAAMEDLELDESQVMTLWNRHQARRVHAGGMIWSVLVLISFYRTHVCGNELT
jgi:asparagine synthase (glutamine-hydrolysing)